MKSKLSQILSSKIVTVMLALTLFASCVVLWNTGTTEVYATETEFTVWDDETCDYAVATYSADTAKTYIGVSAPTVDNYLFAGWFTDVTCTSEYAIRSTSDVTGEYCYAKFVPEDVLSTKVQVSKQDINSELDGDQRNMRFVSSVDNLGYTQIGFRMKYLDENNNWVYKINKGRVVFERIESATEGDEYTFSPKVVDTKSEYFMTATWKGEDNTGLTEDEFDTNFYVRAYFTTFDGIRVYGPTRYVSVNDGLKSNIVNVSIEDEDGTWNAETTGLTASYIGRDDSEESSTENVQLAYYDGTYVHLKIDLGTGVNRATELSSATKITVTDGTNAKSTIYRNLYTIHEIDDSTDINADVSWYQTYYTEDSTEDEYVIATSADLYGLSELVNNNTQRFLSKKIYLVSDIVVNAGNATATGWEATEDATVYAWDGIGNGSYAFVGKFDGQNHTISGLNAIATGEHANRKPIGLFGYTANASAVQNVSVENSYFESTYANGLGVISGRGGGTFRYNHIGSRVYIRHDILGSVGGVLGMVTGATTVENCWFEGNIIAAGQRVGGIVGNGNGQTIIISNCLSTGNIERNFDNITTTLASYDYSDYSSVYKDYSNSVGYYGGIIGGTGTTSNGVYVGDFDINNCISATTMTSAKPSDSIGGVVGQTTGNTSDNIATVTMSNTYCTSDSCGQIIGSANAETVLTDCYCLDDVMLKGINAYVYTGLDFDDEWSALDGVTPELQCFQTSDDEVLSVQDIVRADTNWYESEDYTIDSAAELFGLSKLAATGITFEGETVSLGADIVVNQGNASDWVEGKNVPQVTWMPIQSFAGTFEGGGYTISGLYVDAFSGVIGIGLFTLTNANTTIQNMSITNSYFNGDTSNGTGAIIGQGGGTLNQIYANVIMPSEQTKGFIGGIVGRLSSNLTVTNCWNASDIEAGGQYIGGILGGINSSGLTVIINHCLNTGNIEFSGSATNAYLGGLVGRANGASPTAGQLQITDCLSTGIVDGGTATGYIGGLLGHATKTYTSGEETVESTVITNSYYVYQNDDEGECVGAGNAVGYDQRTTKDGGDEILLKNAMSVNSYFNTELDFITDENADGVWSVREEDTPMLVCFLSEADEIIDVSGMISTEFTLNNNKGYISNLDQLKNFRDKLNAEELVIASDTLIKLTSDIQINEPNVSDWIEGSNLPTTSWEPIFGFSGIFDGQGNTISGLYTTTNYKVTIDSTSTYYGAGLFTNTIGATIKRLNVIDGYINANTSAGVAAVVGKGSGAFIDIYTNVNINAPKGRAGGILGTTSGNISISNCWSACNITSDDTYNGGMIGDCTKEALIQSCLFTGNIIHTKEEGSKEYSGGFTGRSNSKLEIVDCLSVGIIKSTLEDDSHLGAILGIYAGSDAIIEKTYFSQNYNSEGVLEGVQVSVGVPNSYTTQTNVQEIDYDNLLGLNAFYTTKLSYQVSDESECYWAIREDNIPMLVTFLNEGEATIDVSDLDSDVFALVDNKGIIASKAQLVSFRDQINAGSLSVDSNTVITLTDDIVVNEGTASEWADGTATLPSVWTPINGFVGLFDGNGHSISGLYGTAVSGITGIGLFTQTDGATIQNLSIENSYFKVNTSTGSGPVVGCGSGTFKNIYTEVIMIDNNSSQKGRIGGILGKASGEVVIENCWSNSQIESNWIYIGGIVGYSNAQNVSISHCLNTGDMTYTGSTASYFGGIVGSSCSSSATSYTGCLQITDCLNTGTVRGATSETYMGGVIGNAGGLDASGNATVLITNSYATINYDDDNQQIGINILVGNGLEASITDCAVVNYDQSIGEYAYDSMDLDFVTESNEEGYWVVRDENTPMLTSFFQ